MLSPCTVNNRHVRLNICPTQGTDVCVKIDDILYPCVQPPIVAYEETKKVKGVVVSHREQMSLSMPINN